MHATVSIISIYREGNLAIQQAGKNMSVKLTVVCRQCPLLRRGEDGTDSLSELGSGWGREVELRLTYCPRLMGREAFSHEHKGKKNVYFYILFL